MGSVSTADRPTVQPLDDAEVERLRFLVETLGQVKVLEESCLSRVGLLQALSGSNVFAGTRKKIRDYLEMHKYTEPNKLEKKEEP